MNPKAGLDVKAAYKEVTFVVTTEPTNYDSRKNFFDTSVVRNVIELAIKNNSETIMMIKSTVSEGYMASVREKYRCDNIIFSLEFLRECKLLYDAL